MLFSSRLILIFFILLIGIKEGALAHESSIHKRSHLVARGKLLTMMLKPFVKEESVRITYIELLPMIYS